MNLLSLIRVKRAFFLLLLLSFLLIKGLLAAPKISDESNAAEKAKFYSVISRRL